MTIEQIQARIDELYWELECDMERNERIKAEIEMMEREMVRILYEANGEEKEVS
jgi:hypothetical protein